MLCCHVSPAAYRKNGVATAPLLTFTCPKTKERASVDIETDAQTLRASWKSWFEVKCPYCGEVHKISVRDAYLNDAVDIVGRPARPRSKGGLPPHKEGGNGLTPIHLSRD